MMRKLLSRRGLSWAGAAGFFGVVLRPFRFFVNPASAGENHDIAISIDPAGLAFRQVGQHYVILRVYPQAYIILNEEGKALWQIIIRGQTDIASLVKTHATSNNIPSYLAAYQVLNFLDEIRAQGFIRFSDDAVRARAPLVDVPLDGTPLEALTAAGVPLPPPTPLPKPPPKPGFGKSRSACKTVCV